jgi:predicted RNase H-like nuclease (RuvC/YqgF family)
MKRASLIVLALILGFSISACANLDKRIDVNAQKISSLETESETLRTHIESLDAQINDLDSKMESVNSQLEDFSGQVYKIENLEKETQRISYGQQEIEQRLAALEQKIEALFSNPKIKVLSGDGKLSSAKKMSKKLKKMGFNVVRIDYAPRSDFKRNVVFYSQNFQNAAKRIAEGLDKNTAIKPLTWFSVFDIIVVTGKN